MVNVPLPEADRITELLRAFAQGEERALAELMPLVYENLRRLARGQLARERRGHTLDSVALVNEAFLRLAGEKGVVLQDRAHFLGVCAVAMRRILVDYARARNALKRGGAERPEPLDDNRAVAESLPAPEADRVVALDEALGRLEAIDGEACRIVELRFFTGATEEDAARALGISPATARRRWAFAKAWLKREIDADPAS